MTRPTDDTWVVKLDEFHPDPTIAAKYADQEAHLAAHRHFTARIKALAEKVDVTVPSAERSELEWARQELARVNQQIADDKETEDA